MSGFPKFTNEVQHLEGKVLGGHGHTVNDHLKTGARLPKGTHKARRKIAAALDRAPSSISREIKRNCGNKIGDKPAYADEQTAARRWTGSKLAGNGGVENATGRMRRTLPRKTDLDGISPRRLIDLVQAYNATPRKCLDYQTPAKVFLTQLLHFKCESIFSPARE